MEASGVQPMWTQMAILLQTIGDIVEKDAHNYLRVSGEHEHNKLLILLLIFSLNK